MNRCLLRLLLACGLVAGVIGLCVVVIFVLEIGYYLNVLPTGHIAHYPSMSFAGKWSDYRSFRTGSFLHPGEVGDIFIKVLDGRVLRLSDLNEDILASFSDSKTISQSITGDQYITYGVQDKALFYVVNGKVAECTLYRGSPVKIGATASGDFIGIPASRTEIVKAFGSPERYTYTYPRGGM